MTMLERCARARLKELLKYDPVTGHFSWRVQRGNRKVGSRAGVINSKKAVQIKIDGTTYYAHRLAFLYMVGAFPLAEVDHRDGNPTNNSWENLRVATRSQNNANSTRRRDNSSGFKGVHFYSKTGRWRAELRQNGRRVFCGAYDTPEDAHQAYVSAAQEAFGEFANGGDAILDD